MPSTENIEISTPEFTDEQKVILKYSGDIACAYIANNHVAPTELPNLVKSIYEALLNLISVEHDGPSYDKPTVAQIKKSIRPNGIISFIDNKSYKTLKRHLKAHGLDSYGYIQRYGLPEDYPMVCAAFSETRSKLAMEAGLGRSSTARNAKAELSGNKPPRPPTKRAAK